MPKGKVTPFTKILGLVLIAGLVIFGFKWLNESGTMDKIAPKKGGASGPVAKLGKAGKDAIKIGVVTWGGYAGGQYFNGGFKASKESRFFTEYGLLVEFKVLDDFAASRAAWKADEVNLLWITADAFPTEVNSLKEYDPKIVMQADWSRGGDAIVVRRGIANVGDLKGKKIAVAYGTPSHTFLLWLLDANNMNHQDVTLVEVPSAVDAATMFKSGKVDAAVVWSPDDEDCAAKVAGARILNSTREATHIIADVFYAKQEWIDKNEDKLAKLTEGWMRGAAEINSSEDAKQKAAQILAEGLGLDEAFCIKAINNVRLCTYGDNKAFFQIDGCNSCVSGEQLYTKMAEVYADFGLIKGAVPAWRSVVYTGALRQINLAGAEHEAESMQRFAKATVAETKSAAFASKPVSISFASGSATIDENGKYLLDAQVVPTLRAFSAVRVRLEGNTDVIGGREANIALSKRRAGSIADYLSTGHGFDRNRFIEVGNGPDKPVASNDTDEGRARNRRTEIQLLN